MFSDLLPRNGHGADHIEKTLFATHFLLLRARISGVA
jgi:hypothetical protein